MGEKKKTSGIHESLHAVNRRAFPRWPVPYEVLFGNAKESVPAVAVEIGEGGLSVQTDARFEIGSSINVEFRLNPVDAWIKVKCIVRHSDGKSLGVEFLNLRMADRLRIVDFMMAKQ